MKLVWALPVAMLGMQALVLADTIPPGAVVPVRPDQDIRVNRWDRGRIYSGHVAREVRARDGDIAIPAGSPAELIVRQIGPDQFTLDLESVTVNGQRYAMDTSGPQFNLHRNDYDQGSGLVGAIVGAVEGANGENVEARGDHISVPAGAILRFQLQEPLHVVGWNDPGYDQGGYHYHHEHDWYR